MIKEEVEMIKKEVNEIKQESFAYEILSDYKRQNKRLFVIWIITFVALLGLACYTIYLLNDIGVIETSQTIEDIETIEGSNITNGDFYGQDSTEN